MDFNRMGLSKSGIFVASLLLACGMAVAQSLPPELMELMRKNSCMACHKENAKLIGPSFASIRERYATAPSGHLASSMLHGSSGKWGPVPMPANPGLDAASANALASWFAGGRNSRPPETASLAPQPAPPNPWTNPPPSRPEPVRDSGKGMGLDQPCNPTAVPTQIDIGGPLRCVDTKLTIAQCRDRIKAIHQATEDHVKRSAGNPVAIEMHYRNGNLAQAKLFEGVCSHDPQAAGYVATARQGLRDASQVGAATSQPSGTSSRKQPGTDATQCLRIERDHQNNACIKNRCAETVETGWCVEGHDCGGPNFYRNGWPVQGGYCYPVSSSRGRNVRFYGCAHKNGNETDASGGYRCVK